MPPRVHIATLGCRLNEAELLSWSNSFARLGLSVTTSARDADLVVVNTCAVTAQAARKSRKQVSALHRQNPSAKLVVTGCMVELEPKAAQDLLGVDLVLGNQDKDNLVEEVLKNLDVGTMSTRAQEPGTPHAHPDAVSSHGQNLENGLVTLGRTKRPRTRAFVKVQDGCRNRCSYCVVTIARGQERSRPIQEVVKEVQGLTDVGYQEVVLTGVHLGGYGHDLQTDLHALVRAILDETDVVRLRLSSLEPWDLPRDFGSLWTNPKLMPHLHLPLQSGSDSVLRRMARRCFTSEYRDLVTRLRCDVADLNLTTDIIVGFPQETDDEFAESLAFVEEMGFGHVHIFSFSKRDGTKAALMPGQVPGDIMRERSRKMHRVAARSKDHFLQRYVNTRRPILWEGEGQTNETGEQVFLGYTDNYVRAEAVSSSKERLEGTIRDSLIVSLLGTPVDRVLANPYA